MLDLITNSCNSHGVVNISASPLYVLEAKALLMSQLHAILRVAEVVIACELSKRVNSLRSEEHTV